MKSIKIETNLSIKVFYFVIVFIVMFFYVSLNDLKESNQKILNTKMDRFRIVMKKYLMKRNVSLSGTPQPLMKYILEWTSPNTIGFHFINTGQQTFIRRNCSFQNCFITNNRTYLGSYTNFDAIAFHGKEAVSMAKDSLPTERSPHQKYVFGSMESSDYYPICNSRFNNYFNWTWTYKLTPYSRWGYLMVRDSNNKIIGPKDVMHWMKLSDMEPVSEELKDKLKKKTKAAAWFVSNCKSRSGREKIVEKLQEELKKYNLTVDIYGDCGPFKCSSGTGDHCDKIVDNDYHFYLSFENSFAEDYVTEKLLRALKYNVVPIVYGGANYTRFMPDGIYLNARELGIKKLAAKMKELISNPDKYAEYFRWKKHYSYHHKSDDVRSDDYCGFCAMLNDEELVKRTSVYGDFQKWWNPPDRC